MIDNLFVFDFDDTLAETTALIGIARENNGKNDELFRSWLLEHNLYPVNEIKVDGLTYYYLTSEDFANYQKAAAEFISEDTVDHFDFTDTAKVDAETAKQNSELINILKQAENMAKTRVIIVTARSSDNFDSPTGTVTPTNREDIANFLNNAGSNIQASQVFPVGSSQPSAKVSVIKKYIDALGPKTVYFYDDNALNVEAVHQLCDEYGGFPNIITYRVKDGTPVTQQEC